VARPLPALAAAAFAEFGGHRNRQADRAADRQRGVSTSKYVRREGQVIRYNLPWTLFMLGYLILTALFYRGVLPAALQP
jgi:hypothetical protein